MVDNTTSQESYHRKPVNPVPFMADRGAPLNGTALQPSSKTPSLDTVRVRYEAPQRGGVFALPPPGRPRQDSLHNSPLPIPNKIKKLYVAAAAKYKIPWTLLAGIGMEETGHGRNNRTSSAGAQGLMQFMPGTWASMGVDGDGDGRANIHNDADSIHSAAHYLTQFGVRAGIASVRRAPFAYNHVGWYVNDVLYYASRYGGGNTLPVDPNNCRSRVGNPKLPSHTTEHVAKVLAGPKATTATPTGWVRPDRTPGIAPASPKPPTPASASRCPAPPQCNETGSPPATAPASDRAKKNQAT